MKISTRGRYAIRSAMCLASTYGQGPVSLKKVPKNQEISAKYLENIMRLMIKFGLVNSTKGKNGGFILAKDPASVRVVDILNIVEGSLAPVYCVDKPGKCSRSELCAARDIWAGLEAVISDYLGSITIADLVRKQMKKHSDAGKKAPCL